MQRALPAGVVTFLFTDVEGSTRLLHELGTTAFTDALLEHRQALREAFNRHGGMEIGTEGDSFFVVFPTPQAAVAAAGEGQEALAPKSMRVRMGAHTGVAEIVDGDYVGADVHLAARIAAAGHGGQVLLSGATAALLDPAMLTALGEHRFKDFERPIPVFQLGSERFPPLRTLSNTNLPRPASVFVGRDPEISEIVSFLRDGTRILTLTGPGGSGKTRLAIEAAAELVGAFRAGVFWVNLTPLRDPALVTAEIATSLGAGESLGSHIADREMLLVLDNLEQVVESGPELASLVESCPHLRLLLTSREPLRVRGEVEYPVSPLADAEAVELFCTRARLKPADSISRLCAALDNLPLAIELAAARTKVLSPDKILERISQRLDLLSGGRDAEARQKTLRATIEWSHNLLSEEEQALFARISVFRGGCTLETAEEVIEADLDTLASLVDKSLLRQRNDRFWMLETIREYATERLEASGNGTFWQRRHAEYFISMAEDAYPNLKGSPKEWLDRLEAEHDNLRAALDRLQSWGATQEALRLAGALWKFWSIRGHVPEGIHRLEGLLQADIAPTKARARALEGVAGLSVDMGNPDKAEHGAQEAMHIYQANGDEVGVAYARYLTGSALAERGEHFESARMIFQDSVGTFQRLGEDHYQLLALRALAWMHSELGDDQKARESRREYQELAEATGNHRALALAKQMMADAAVREGRFEDALRLAKDAFEINRAIGETRNVADDLRQLAEVLIAAGHPYPAASVLSTAQALTEEIGGKMQSWVSNWQGELLDQLHSHLDDRDFAEAWERGRALTAEEAIGMAHETVGR